MSSEVSTGRSQKERCKDGKLYMFRQFEFYDLNTYAYVKNITTLTSFLVTILKYHTIQKRRW